MIGALAALLTAAGGLAAQLKSAKPTGKPWIIGLAALAVVGVVLLVVALVPGTSHTGSSAGQMLRPYQDRVVGICTEDREVELGFNRQMDQMQQDFTSGDFSAVFSVPKLMTATVVEEQSLADRLEALDAPADLDPAQSEAVSTWRRKIAVSRGTRDQMEQEVAASGGDALKFAQAVASLDYKEESRLESQKDVLLRRLGGPGCKPSP